MKRIPKNPKPVPKPPHPNRTAAIARCIEKGIGDPTEDEIAEAVEELEEEESGSS